MLYEDYIHLLPLQQVPRLACTVYAHQKHKHEAKTKANMLKYVA